MNQSMESKTGKLKTLTYQIKSPRFKSENEDLDLFILNEAFDIPLKPPMLVKIKSLFCDLNQTLDNTKVFEKTLIITWSNLKIELSNSHGIKKLIHFI